MTSITIRLSDEQAAKLYEGAKMANTTVTSFIKNKLFGDGTNGRISLPDIVTRIKTKIQPGAQFDLNSLYTQKEWDAYTGQNYTGRAFNMMVKNGNLNDLVEFVGKVDGKSAVYRRK